MARFSRSLSGGISTEGTHVSRFDVTKPLFFTLISGSKEKPSWPQETVPNIKKISEARTIR
jgi:hypothetical protein